MEFLTAMSTRVPAGAPEAVVDGTEARAAVRSGELAIEDHLLRLRNPPVEPGEWRTPGLWNADHEGQLQGVVATMLPHVWMTVEVTPSSHIRVIQEPRRVRTSPDAGSARR
jgi:muconolactone D-isomerase